MIYETLRTDLNEARKARDSDKVLALSTVLGEIAAGAKMVDGEKVIDDTLAAAVIKKTIKGLDDLISFGDNPKASAEKSLLESYLPQQMSSEEISEAIALAISEGASNMGAIMAALKAKHHGLYDGKLASGLANKALAK